jgi:hypothetical protein
MRAMSRSTRLAASLCLSILFGLAACGPSDGGDPDGGGDGDGGAATLVIEPAHPSVVVRNGVAEAVGFSARLIRAGAEPEEVTAAWSIDRVQLGGFSAGGSFLASGAAAGVGTVTATVEGLSATTTVTVKVDDEHLVGDVPADAPDRFPDTPLAGGDQAPSLLYPLDGALMPSSVKAPHLQWEGGVEGDLYRVVVTAGLARVTAYLSHGGGAFDFAWLVAQSSWETLKSSAGDEPITIVVDRWAAATEQTHRSQSRTVRVVDANVSGAIYYWDLSGGKILRITEDGRDDFLPSPPPNPENGSRCVACHVVSRDGSLLAVEMWGGDQPGAVFDLTIDLTADPAPTVVPPDRYTALFSTFNPTGDRLMINRGTALSLVDIPGGNPVTTTGTPLPQSGAAHPTWSPDGSLVAYIAGTNGSWAVDFTLGDLAVIPATGPENFGNTTVLRPAEGLANSWPSFSPDSQWIAFGRGVNSRGRSGVTDYPGSLWLIHRNGGDAIELAAANGGALQSYLPSFSPFDEGGYFWLAFYSTRDYGNAQAGTRGTGRRQLWVTAVSRNPQPGVDPSHVPFWLPDQDRLTDNMSAYWAPAPPVQ